MPTYMLLPAPGRRGPRTTVTAIVETERERDALLHRGQGRLMAVEVDPEWGHVVGGPLLSHDWDRSDVLARAWRWHDGRIIQGPLPVERWSNRPHPAADPRYL